MNMPVESDEPPTDETPELETATDGASGADANTSAKFLAAFVITVLLCGGLCALGSAGGDDAPDESVTAMIMCEDFVKDRLKAPSTAEFSDARVSVSGADYTVVGEVDAQNGFGAMVRASYICVVRDSPDDTWALQELELLE